MLRTQDFDTWLVSVVIYLSKIIFDDIWTIEHEIFIFYVFNKNESTEPIIRELKIYKDSDLYVVPLYVRYARLVINEIVNRTICGGKTIYFAFTSKISTVMFSTTGSVMLFIWFGDLLDFIEIAEAFPLLVGLPRRGDPGDRDFLAKVSRAFAWKRGSTNEKPE